jgi:hypothetical protein
MTEATAPLTRTEKQIIRLLGLGFTRWKVAELACLSDTAVRDLTAGLCQRYDCGMYELPQEAQGDY